MMNEESLHSWSNYYRHAGKGVIQCKDGTLIAMFEVSPLDYQSASPEELNLQRDAFSQCVNTLGTGWGYYATLVRSVAEEYPAPSRNHYSNYVGHLVDNEIRNSYEYVRGDDGAKPYESKLVYCLTYTPAAFSKQGLMKLLFRESSEITTVDDREQLLFEKALANFVGLLDAKAQLHLTRYELYTEETEDGVLVKCPMIGFLRGLLFNDYRPVIVYDSDAMPDISDLIFTDNIKFGSTDVVIGKRRFRCIAVHGFPHRLKKQAMRVIGQTAMPLAWTSRYISLDAIDSKRVLDVYKRNFKIGRYSGAKRFVSKEWAEDDKSLASDVGEQVVSQTKLGIEKGDYGGGFYTSVITVFGDTAKEVDDRAEAIKKALDQAHIISMIEEVATLEAFMSTLPGNHYTGLSRTPSKSNEDGDKPMKERYRERQHFATTVHASSLVPTTGLWSGERVHPSENYEPNSPPLLYLDSTGNTPHRMTTFVDDLGHAAMYGQTGSGKSTTLNLFGLMQQKYKSGLTLALDKDFSFYVQCRLVGGHYYDLTAPDGPQFCPLEHIDDPAERDWVVSWLALMCGIGGIKPTAAVRSVLREMVVDAAHGGIRNMTEMINSASNVPSEIIEVLREYTSDASVVGRLLDGQPGDIKPISDVSMVCFEMGELFKAAGMGDTTVPLSQYLFHLFKKMLDGRPTQVIIDEGHNWIREPKKITEFTFDFGVELEKWLLEMRKANGYLLFATQNVAAVAEASATVRAALSQSTASRFFLADKNALEAQAMQAYKAIGLSRHEIGILAGSKMKRDMLIFKKSDTSTKTEPKRRLAALSMSKLMVNTVGVTNKKLVEKVVMPLISEHGEDPLEWHSRFCVGRGVVRDVEEYKRLVSKLAVNLTKADRAHGFDCDWSSLWGI